jgi:spore coat protein U-like protein
MNAKLACCVFVVSSTLAATARVEAACTVSATGVSFGTYDVFTSGADTSTGTITYRCAASTAAVQITISTGASPTYTPRTLVKGGEKLQYNLYQDSAYLTIWGDGTGGTGTYTRANPPKNQDVILTIFGRVPAQQDVSVGNYNDTLVVTINF